VKLFCVSDIHSYWEPFKTALDAAGFEENNINHLLVVLGDCFDRGPDTVQVYKFLNSLTNIVLIRGNHEDLLEEMLDRGYGEKHDHLNGTTRSVVDLCDIVNRNTSSSKECCDAVKELIMPFLNKFVNYFETEHYIFVHSFIALECLDNLPKYYVKNRAFKFDPNWRNADNDTWELARWGNPFKLAGVGLNQTSKVILHGHWHNSWPRSYYDGQPECGEEADFSPYYGNNCIGLDACTVVSNTCNVLVLEDDLLEEIQIPNSTAK
jgi:predicted MPP superfamily phosphohydrolase